MTEALHAGIFITMDTFVRKTPSYLKGLAETRARAAGDMARCQPILDEINSKIAEAQATLDACDRLIKKFDIRLDPTQIEPVRAWKGHYGKRGAFKAALVAYLKEAAPEAVTTNELALYAQLTFGLDFVNFSHMKTWRENSLLRGLKCLVAKGLVERLHALSLGTTELGRWRWIADGCQSLDGLVALAEVKGVGTTSDAYAIGDITEGIQEADDLPV